MAEAKTYVLDTIKYKRKEIDKGLILGERPYKWTLKRKYNPCYAKIVDGEYCSELSPHKRNFKVYIPASILQEGSKIHIYKRDYQRDPIDITIEIVKVDGNIVKIKRLKTLDNA